MTETQSSNLISSQQHVEINDLTLGCQTSNSASSSNFQDQDQHYSSQVAANLFVKVRVIKCIDQATAAGAPFSG